MVAPAQTLKLATVTKGRLPPRGGEREVRLSKVDDAKQIVYGVVLDPYIVDAHDDWIPPAEVEKTAHDYLASYRAVKVEHDKPALAHPVESFLMPYPSAEDYKKAMGNEPHRVWKFPLGVDHVHSGAWVLGMRVMDSGVWAAVKSGELGAFSIGAWGTREPMASAPLLQVEVLSIEVPA